MTQDLRAHLLALRSEIDAILSKLDGAGPSAPAPARFMKVADFAKAHALSARTIRDYCDLGMPHRGEGKGRRIVVAEADEWIAAGGPRRARAERKGKAA